MTAKAARAEAARVYGESLTQFRARHPREHPAAAPLARTSGRATSLADRLAGAVTAGMTNSQILAALPVTYYQIRQARRSVAERRESK